MQLKAPPQKKKKKQKTAHKKSEATQSPGQLRSSEHSAARCAALRGSFGDWAEQGFQNAGGAAWGFRVFTGLGFRVQGFSGFMGFRV